jgi:TIR domain
VKIFLSYRRADSKAITGRLDEHLRRSFGKTSVFLDIDNIPAGENFETHLPQALEACDLCIAVVGPNWADARLHSPSDFVRKELEHALKEDIPIIPILVDGAQLPTSESLPEALRPLLTKQALPLDSGSDFLPHFRRLSAQVERFRPKTRSRPKLVAGSVGLTVLGIAIAYAGGAMSSSSAQDPPFNHCDQAGSNLVTFFRSRADFEKWIQDHSLSPAHESFGKFANREPITSLFDARLSVSGSEAFFGNWAGENRVPGDFRGGALISKHPKPTPSDWKWSIVFTAEAPVVALGANLYDDGNYRDKKDQSGILRMFVTTNSGSTAYATDCEHHLGDTGFLGAVTKDGMTRVSFTSDTGAFELDNLAAAWRP